MVSQGVKVWSFLLKIIVQMIQFEYSNVFQIG